MLTDARVAAVATNRLLFDGRPPLEADAVLWVTKAAAPAWLGATGLPRDAAGFIAVGAGLDVVGCPGIFAAGDAASFGPRDLPKAGVYAVRQGSRSWPATSVARSPASRPDRIGRSAAPWC